MSQTNPLHDLMRNATADFGTEEERAWLVQVKAALDAGALPNELDEHDMSPLAILVDSGIGNSSGYKDGIALMIERGANPLINDRALGKAAASAAIGPDGGIAGAMLAAVIREEEKGRELRSETGETALHVLCADAPESVSRYVWADYGSAMGEARIPASWYSAKDDEGNAALHSMWGANGIIVLRLEADMDVDDQFPAWDGMEAMLEKGADLLVRDGNRETVANLVVQCVEMGMETEGASIWEQVEALATHERLDENTGPAQSKGSKPPRI